MSFKDWRSRRSHRNENNNSSAIKKEKIWFSGTMWNFVLYCLWTCVKVSEKRTVIWYWHVTKVKISIIIFLVSRNTLCWHKIEVWKTKLLKLLEIKFSITRSVDYHYHHQLYEPSQLFSKERNIKTRFKGVTHLWVQDSHLASTVPKG